MGGGEEEEKRENKTCCSCANGKRQPLNYSNFSSNDGFVLIACGAALLTAHRYSGGSSASAVIILLRCLCRSSLPVFRFVLSGARRCAEPKSLCLNASRFDRSTSNNKTLTMPDRSRETDDMHNL